MKMKIRARIITKPSSANRQRLGALAAPAAISVRKQLEASRGKALDGLIWEQYFTFVNFFAVPGKALFTWLFMAASAWAAIGAGFSLLRSQNDQAGFVPRKSG